MPRIEITEAEFNAVRELQRRTEANRCGGHYASALHVYRSTDGRGVVDQFYAHSSHGITTVEVDGNGKFWKYVQ